VKLNDKIKGLFEEWVESRGLSDGAYETSVDTLLVAFLGYVDGKVPVTKAYFGRLLTSRFLKKQNRKTLKQNYYVNVDLTGGNNE